MKIIEWVKKFGLKVWNKIEDHLATIVAGSIILILSTLCIFFWKWIITKHSVEFYGGIWLLLCLTVLFLLLHFVFIMLGKIRKIKDPADIRNVLDKWWRHAQEQSPNQVEFTLYFASIDKKEQLKKGSAKKYLRAVVTKDEKWGIVREGPDTLLVKRHESRQKEIVKDILKKAKQC